MENNKVYLGYREIEFSDEELCSFYGAVGAYAKEGVPLANNMVFFPDDLLENEYLIIKNNGNVCEKAIHKNGRIYQILKPSIKESMNGTVTGRNIYQDFAINMLKDDSIKVKLIRGVYGAGKDMLMMSYAMSQLDAIRSKSSRAVKYEKLVFLRPNLTVAGLPDIGYLPGDEKEKLAWTLGPIQDKVGGPEELDMLMKKGTIELIPMPYIRGRSFENAIVYVTEGQNMTTEIAKLLISRIGDNSILMINGDTHQTDKAIFDKDNGLTKMVERLSGDPLFGYVYLPTTERGAVANLANKLDN